MSTTNLFVELVVIGVGASIWLLLLVVNHHQPKRIRVGSAKESDCSIGWPGLFALVCLGGLVCVENPRSQ